MDRIYCTGTPEDYAAVHGLQDNINLVPLSAYGKSYTPPEGHVDPAIDNAGALVSVPDCRWLLTGVS